MIIAPFSVPLLPIPMSTYRTVPVIDFCKMVPISEKEQEVISVADEEIYTEEEKLSAPNSIREIYNQPENKQVRWKKKDDICLFQELERH